MDKIRGLIVTVAFIALFLALFFFVQFTGFLFDIQQKYAESPTWLVTLYIGGVAVIAFFGLILIYKVSKLGGKTIKAKTEKPREITDDESFQRKMQSLQAKGADTNEIESDWKNLLSIRQNEAVTVALFGEINAGKSALIQALTGRQTDISARGGKTQIITSYPLTYQNRRYEWLDMPGLNEVGETGFMEELVREKAIKSHVVVWLMDEEMTHSSFIHYQHLKAFDKPIIIAVNKADYYSDSERRQISQRIHSELGTKITVVWICSATTKIVERHHPDGRIETQEQHINANIDELASAIEALTFDRLTLDNRLNNSYFKQLEISMAQSLSKVRSERAQQVVKSYSQKAIFGGMAAVGPGSDVLLQGYLGMGMTRALCDIYDVDTQSVDLEGTLALLSDKMKKELALVLALTGNVLKAFPGIGTVAGGAAHAVAYGLIFESVGKAMTACLESHQGLDKTYLEQQLHSQLQDNLENRALRLAKAVILKQ